MTMQETQTQTQTIEVIFENGMLKPLTPLENIFTEGQHLQVTVQPKPPLPKSVEEIDYDRIYTPEEVQEMSKFIEFKSYGSIEEIRRSPLYNLKVARRAGSLKGKIWMSDDFDEPLEEFKDYM
jgi:predicted DNA-binding antitoxin AbrB/MazE fold protein